MASNEPMGLELRDIDTRPLTIQGQKRGKLRRHGVHTGRMSLQTCLRRPSTATWSGRLGATSATSWRSERHINLRYIRARRFCKNVFCVLLALSLSFWISFVWDFTCSVMSNLWINLSQDCRANLHERISRQHVEAPSHGWCSYERKRRGSLNIVTSIYRDIGDFILDIPRFGEFGFVNRRLRKCNHFFAFSVK